MSKARILTTSVAAALLLGVSGGAAVAQTDTPNRPPTAAEAPGHHGRDGGMGGGMTHEGTSGRHGRDSDQPAGRHHQGPADRTARCDGTHNQEQPSAPQPDGTTHGDHATS